MKRVHLMPRGGKRITGVLAALGCMAAAHADPYGGPPLIAIGTLNLGTDLSGLSGTLENGVDSANVLGGLGSGLAWAGGDTFLAIPDRGPNATAYTGGAGLDNTTSYISRFDTLSLDLTAGGGALPYSLTPTLSSTTLFYSITSLSYGAATAGLPSGVPSVNTDGKYYFTGRSDGFSGSTSLNPNNARLDPEGIRVSPDGKSVFISDEYGPYIYQFDRATGARIRTIDLPSNLGIANQSASGDAEIAGNISGRVANKGMEGLAITPDGTTLVGFMQSPLIQDSSGSAGKGRVNRIVTVNIQTGETHEYAYDNQLADGSSNNSSEIVAINDHQFLVLERDGKGLGDGSAAKVKQVYKVDLSGATDVSNLSGEANLLPYAVSKTMVLDIKAAMNAAGISNTSVPSKLESLAFGDDVTMNGQVYHTLYIANDNDFLPGTSGSNYFYAFALSDADLGLQPGEFVNESISEVPLPAGIWLLGSGLGALGLLRRRRTAAKG